MCSFWELIIDPACSVVFEMEPDEPDIMQRPPRKLNAALVWALDDTFWTYPRVVGILAVVAGSIRIRATTRDWGKLKHVCSLLFPWSLGTWD